MKISIISAIGENSEIGKDNKLLWKQSDDLKRFKKLTTGKVIIMGKNTYDSLPFKPLPNRTNIVITDDYDDRYFGAESVFSINEAIDKAIYWGGDGEVFVIGGASIYKQFIGLADKLYITKIHDEFDADTYFPEIDDSWVETSSERFNKDDKNEYDYSYVVLEKK